MPPLSAPVPARSPNPKVPDPASNVAITYPLHIFPPVSPIVLIGWHDTGCFATKFYTLIHCFFIKSSLRQRELMLLNQGLSFWDSGICNRTCGIYAANANFFFFLNCCMQQVASSPELFAWGRTIDLLQIFPTTVRCGLFPKTILWSGIK